MGFLRYEEKLEFWERNGSFLKLASFSDAGYFFFLFRNYEFGVLCNVLLSGFIPV